jgi:hypothetical protein
MAGKRCMNKLPMNKSLLFINDLISSCLSVLKIIILSKWFPENYRKKQSRPCLILGNGPSLTEGLAESPELVQDCDLMVTNFFAESPIFEELKPRYYVMIDPIFYLDKVKEFYIEKRNELFKSLVGKTSWELTLLLPFEAKINPEIIKLPRLNSKISLLFFNKTPIEGFASFRNCCFKNRLGMPRPHNVMIPSIILALNSGYTRVFLIGTDHNWIPKIIVEKDNRTVMLDEHFYEPGKSVTKPMYHEGRTERKLHEVLFSFYNVFKGYHIIKRYSDSIGAEIYNLTEGSYIDAFKKVKYKDIL